MTHARALIAGNWKMHGLDSSLSEARALIAWLDGHPAKARVALCPPATLISRMAVVAAGSPLEVGAQDCAAEMSGAFTGDISAAMLADAGAGLVILGHSERRTLHGETDADVAAKVIAALESGLEPIVCVGETEAERRSGEALGVVAGQIRGSLPAELAGRRFAVAYEPLWAIGTGLTASISDIETMHAAIQRCLDERFASGAAPILYGGSVKPANAGEIIRARGVGGALVGGASLKASEFIGILGAA